jgi:hypothetical protein
VLQAICGGGQRQDAHDLHRGDRLQRDRPLDQEPHSHLQAGAAQAVLGAVGRGKQQAAEQDPAQRGYR